MDGNDRRAFFVAPGQGPKLWVFSELITIVAGAADTGGQYGLTDSLVPPQGDAPPHVHEREDEAFWVIEGEIEVLVGEERHLARAGSFVHLPKGIVHAYRNVGPAAARFLTLMVPGGLERFFHEVGKPAAGASTPPPFDEADIVEMVEVAARYGVTMREG